MSKRRLRDRIAVACPSAETESRLETFFARNRDFNGTTHMMLRVPMDPIGGLAGLALEHGVRVRARRDRDDQNLNDLIRIAWEPEGGGPYPKFQGTLVTWAEHDPPRTFIELDGVYEPPMGAGGQAFDATVGHAIARRTARALLEDLGRAIENDSVARIHE